MRGAASQPSLPGLRQLHGGWESECQPLAETERWQGYGRLTTDTGKISAEAAGLKAECAPGSFWLNLSVIASSLQSIFVNIFFPDRVLSHQVEKPCLPLPVFLLYSHKTITVTALLTLLVTRCVGFSPDQAIL